MQFVDAGFVISRFTWPESITGVSSCSPVSFDIFGDSRIIDIMISRIPELMNSIFFFFMLRIRGFVIKMFLRIV